MLQVQVGVCEQENNPVLWHLQFSSLHGQSSVLWGHITAA